MGAFGGGTREEVDVYFGYLAVAKFDVANTVSFKGLAAFAMLQSGNDGFGGDFGGAFGEYTGFGCAYAGDIANGIHTGELCFEVVFINGYPAIFGKRTLQYYLRGNMFRDTEEKVERHFAFIVKNGYFAGRVDRTYSFLGMKLMPRSAKAVSNALEESGDGGIGVPKGITRLM